MRYPRSIQNLIEMFGKLPTVGPKTAERYVSYLLKQSGEELKKFAEALAGLKNGLTVCEECLALAETNPCAICSDRKRNRSLLAVVARWRDAVTLENTGQFSGLYHVLGGEINPLEEMETKNLNSGKLLDRLKNGPVEEIIIATSPTMEGETTALYLKKIIKENFPRLKITRLARGLPMGADLEYSDEITLANALKYRNEI